jgi:hypothetical protein
VVDLFHCTVPKLFIRKRYYVLFLIPLLIVQVTKLVQFTSIIHFENSAVNINARCNSYEDTACCSSVQCNTSISETIQNRTHVHIHFLFRMADTMTSQNIDLSSWDTDCVVKQATEVNFASFAYNDY